MGRAEAPKDPEAFLRFATCIFPLKRYSLGRNDAPEYSGTLDKGLQVSKVRCCLRIARIKEGSEYWQ